MTPKRALGDNASLRSHPTGPTLMLIDCHVHLNNYHADRLVPTAEHCKELFDKMDERGVDHAVVLTSYRVSPERPGVEEILQILDRNPRISVVEGLRWRGESRTDLFAMEERIRDGVIAGIKLYPGYENYAINDPSLETVYRMAAKHDVPVMIHTGDTYSKGAKVRNSHPLLVDDVAVDFPDTKIIMCHAGNPWFVDTAQVLYKNDNVFADISGLTLGQFSTEFERFMRNRLMDMIMYMGDPGRQLLYGSDWPLVRMAPYVDFLDSLEFDHETKEQIAWKSSARLFKIDIEATKAAVDKAPNFHKAQIS
jgi:predicted TIM-barrel fold metal-dependent hydrolase